MAGVEVNHAHLRCGQAVNTTGIHKAHRSINLIGDFLIAFALWALCDKPKVPTVYFIQICVAALGKGAEQVECRSRLSVSRYLSGRVWNASFCCEFNSVNDITTVAWQFDTILNFYIFRARFGKLTCHSSDFNNWKFGAKCQHHGHLKHHTECVTNIICLMFDKTFSTITTL